MAFIPFSNTAEAVVNGTYEGKPIAHVLNFRYSGGYTQTNMDDLATVVDAWVRSDYQDEVSASVNYVSTLCRGLTAPIDIFSTNATSAGPMVGAGVALPANVSACISLRTGLTGRSARGRFYAWPFITTGLASPNVWLSSYIAAVISDLIALRSNALALGWAMVVASRYSGGVARAAGVTFPVTGIISVNNGVDSQRHRLNRPH